MKAKGFFAGLAAGVALAWAIPAAAAALTAAPSTQPVYLNGRPAQLPAYTIQGSNYVRLRDLGALLDLSVTYEPISRSVQLDTNRPYDSQAQRAGGFDPAQTGDSRQVVLVVTPDSSSDSAAVYAYEQDALGQWRMALETWGRVGSRGIAPIGQRRQGSRTTPAGVMSLTGAYGLSPDPGGKFPYSPIEEDMYWDLNSGSPTYNRLVRGDPGGDREHLSAFTDTYLYLLTTDYNLAQTPDQGGAIFLHCNGKGATTGCVSVPLEQMEWLMRWADPACSPKLIVTRQQDVHQYFR